MKNLTLIALVFLLLNSTSTQAGLTIRIMGVKNKIIYQEKINSHFSDVGELTHTVLANAIRQGKLTEYKGSVGGVTSINQMGNQIEVISNTEMNAYGWCYKVDGIAPDVMPDSYLLTGKEVIIDWFFAYAHMVNNTWTSMCTPAEHKPQ